jgi:hypothetical protein
MVAVSRKSRGKGGPVERAGIGQAEGSNSDGCHFVVQTNDGHAEKGDGVVSAQNSFLVFVDAKNFMQGGEVSDVKVVEPGGHQAIEAGLAEFLAG